MIFLQIAGTLKGIGQLWIIGDVDKEQYFTMTNFKVNDFMTTRYASCFSNILAQIIALHIHGIKQEKYLPKVIVLVFDDDIIKQTNFQLDPDL